MEHLVALLPCPHCLGVRWISRFIVAGILFEVVTCATCDAP